MDSSPITNTLVAIRYVVAFVIYRYAVLRGLIPCVATGASAHARTQQLIKDSDQLDHGKVELMKAIEKETLIGRIKWEIGEIPKQELDTMADCYYFGATDLIHFARDINIFTPEQERYFTSKAYTAYREYTKRRNENV